MKKKIKTELRKNFSKKWAPKALKKRVKSTLLYVYLRTRRTRFFRILISKRRKKIKPFLIFRLKKEEGEPLKRKKIYHVIKSKTLRYRGFAFINRYCRSQIYKKVNYKKMSYKKKKRRTSFAKIKKRSRQYLVQSTTNVL